MNDVFLRYKDLPFSIRAFTVTDENNNYNIYVNSRLSITAQTQALKHELKHINNNHFFDNESAKLSEFEVDNFIAGEYE